MKGSMYQDYEKSETVPLETLVGRTLKTAENKNDEVVFVTSEGETFRQVYYEDCCASCSVEEIHGDLSDLVGTPVLMAEEVSSGEPVGALKEKRDKEKAEAEAKGDYYYSGDSETWTFYKLATIKGSVTIRWYGSSNGYYSESPTFERLKG